MATPGTVEQNRLDARQKLSFLARASDDPTLCPPELDYCLELSRISDDHLNAPISTNWCGAWNLNRAAYEAWLLKAGKCASFHDITIDGRTFSASQVYKQCNDMADRFRRRLAGTIDLGYSNDAVGLPLTCTCP